MRDVEGDEWLRVQMRVQGVWGIGRDHWEYCAGLGLQCRTKPHWLCSVASNHIRFIGSHHVLVLFAFVLCLWRDST